jgi:hypothetical protein
VADVKDWLRRAGLVPEKVRAAVWAWHLRLGPIHNVTAESHPAMVKMIAEFNRKYATIGARP